MPFISASIAEDAPKASPATTAAVAATPGEAPAPRVRGLSRQQSKASATPSKPGRLPPLASIPKDDSGYVFTTPEELPFKHKRAFKAAELDLPPAAAIKERIILQNEMQFDRDSAASAQFAETHIGGAALPRVSRQSLLQTSKLCTTSMVRQARDLLDPSRRGRQSDVRPLESFEHGLIYEQILSGEFAVDDDAGPSAPGSVSSAASTVSTNMSRDHGDETSRMLGTSRIQATLGEFIETFARGSHHGQDHLNAGHFTCERLQTLVDEPNKWVTVNWMILEPKSRSKMARARDFLVVECQKRFQMPDGRRGWVQSLHSVDMPWCPVERDTKYVRGALRHSGVVALESKSNKSLHVMVAAEIDLKGHSSGSAQRALSRRRVVKILSSLASAIEAYRVERLSFLGTHRFREVERHRKEATCKICNDRLSKLPCFKSRHTCRKCGGSVCSKCSQLWNVERQRSDALVGGGRVCTETRICAACLGGAREKTAALTALPSVAEVAPVATEAPAKGPAETDTSRFGLAATTRPGMMGAGKPSDKPAISARSLRCSMLEFKLSTRRAVLPVADLATAGRAKAKAEEEEAGSDTTASSENGTSDEEEEDEGEQAVDELVAPLEDDMTDVDSADENEEDARSVVTVAESLASSTIPDWCFDPEPLDRNRRQSVALRLSELCV